MNDLIFLSKNGTDNYINMFANGCKTLSISTADFDYNQSNEPIVLRGISKHKIIKKCWEDNRTFFYIDTGYFGNEPTIYNPNGWKLWHRIVKNNLQHSKINNRADDRFLKLNKKFSKWKKDGRYILITAPDEKPCNFYGITLDDWITETTETLKKYTDRPFIIRHRIKNKTDRIHVNKLSDVLKNDIFALVTFNSISAIESIFQGIPAFTLAPVNAASPVSLQDLSLINTPYYPSYDKLYQWACHLSYGQVHVEELKSGKARKIMEMYEENCCNLS